MFTLIPRFFHVLLGKLFPVWLGFGFALGKSYAEGGALLTRLHDDILRGEDEGERK